MSSIVHKISSRLGDILNSLIDPFITGVPGGLGRRLRYQYYKRRLKYLGAGAVIDVGVRILNPRFVSIGDNTWIDNYVIIMAGPPGTTGRKIHRRPNPAYRFQEGEVVIGRNCHIAPFVVLQGHGGLSIGDDCGIADSSSLYSMSHHYSNPEDRSDQAVYKFTPMAPAEQQSLIVSPVVMENNSALGLHSVMLPGATIGEGSWVGSNALVMKPIPPFSIATGNPAEVKKLRFA